jgi:PAS domain S-box-containing protein
MARESYLPEPAEGMGSEGATVLRRIMDAVPVGIAFFDVDQRFRFANKSYETFTGRSPADMIGKTLAESAWAESYLIAQPYAERALAGESVKFENVIPKDDGDSLTVVVSYIPDRRPDGTVSGFFSLVEDVTARDTAEKALRQAYDGLEQRVVDRTRELTDANAQLRREFDERKHAEAALRDSEFRYRHIFDASPIGVWEEDYSGAKRVIDGLKAQGVTDFRRHFRDHPDALRRAVQAITIIDVNEATLKIHGASDKQAFIRGRTEKRPELAHFYVEELSMLAEGHMMSTQEAPLLRHDGTTAMVRNISIISDAYAETWERLITTEEDITERRHAEDTMRQARDDADQASRAKSNFLAHMSHELRTPLNAIMGFAEMISSEMLGAIENTKYRDYATDIGKSGQHLLKLIDDILDLSKIEFGKLDLNETDVDIAAMVDACTPLVARRAEQGGVAIHVEIPPDLPAIRGDERRLKQIVINLMANAVSFTPNGGRVSVGASVEPSGDFALWVSDTGVGIAPEDLATVMEVFGQVGDVFSREHQGSGLGLPFSRGLAERHGGTLHIESTLGDGTTATLRLPADRTVPAERAGA